MKALSYLLISMISIMGGMTIEKSKQYKEEPCIEIVNPYDVVYDIDDFIYDVVYESDYVYECDSTLLNNLNTLENKVVFLNQYFKWEKEHYEQDN